MRQKRGLYSRAWCELVATTKLEESAAVQRSIKSAVDFSDSLSLFLSKWVN